VRVSRARVSRVEAAHGHSLCTHMGIDSVHPWA
jgi:hypothetical protein